MRQRACQWQERDVGVEGFGHDAVVERKRRSSALALAHYKARVGLLGDVQAAILFNRVPFAYRSN